MLGGFALPFPRTSPRVGRPTWRFSLALPAAAQRRVGRSARWPFPLDGSGARGSRVGWHAGLRVGSVKMCRVGGDEFCGKWEVARERRVAWPGPRRSRRVSEAGCGGQLGEPPARLFGGAVGRPGPPGRQNRNRS